MMVSEAHPSYVWPNPKSREVGLFTDLSLYADALALARENGSVTSTLLQRALSERMQNLRLVLFQSERTVERLLRELRNFGWMKATNSATAEVQHVITLEGQEALALARQDYRQFLRRLTGEMQHVYSIPGWFIARLWDINPKDQGEVILPAPVSSWSPYARRWDQRAWDEELNSQVLIAAQLAREASPHAFPLADQVWLQAVKSAWERLSSLEPRNPGVKGPVSFSPRRRLAVAMREASVSLLFNRIPYASDKPDFSGSRPPIYLRTFMGWCPRLEALELIFYTDWHPKVAGRLLFPLCAFRSVAPENRFECLEQIKDPGEKALWLHQPRWQIIRAQFIGALISAHTDQAATKGSLYVSLLDLRDEVCRQLRLSSICFDRFLELAMRELPSADFPWSAALETDIRKEQQGGAGPLRRPVYHDGVPHSLIAIARLAEDSKNAGRGVA